MMNEYNVLVEDISFIWLKIEAHNENDAKELAKKQAKDQYIQRLNGTKVFNDRPIVTDCLREEG